MPSSSRSGFLFVALASVGMAVAGCGRSSTPAQTCHASSECSAGARCIAGACVANAAPNASIALPPGVLETNLLLSFDGGASADPDPGDSIASYAWSFRSVTASCAPPAVADTKSVANVRFACPGRYAVDLTVTDQMSGHGVATKEIDVLPYSGPAFLAIGPDVTVGHTCSDGPRRCAPSGPVALSAVPTEAAPPNLTFAWTVEPPQGLVIDATRRVALTPGADASSPTVSIETDGQAISGDWIFHLEARDPAGVVATGAVRVSVGNRPPVVTSTIPEFQHTFDPGASLFSVIAKILVDVVDPDGDTLVSRTVTWNHVNDGGAYFATLDEADGVSVSIIVPYTAPGDAAFLIGGPGLERTVTFSISDVNGATVTDVWPVVVANRAPVPVSLPASVSTGHGFDGSSYVASATLSTWSDPDGDPISGVTPTSDPSCAPLQVLGGAAQVGCSLAYTGAPAVGLFARAHAITYQVTDPWAVSTPVTTSLEITNRSPRLTKTSAGPPGLCTTSLICCEVDPETRNCLGYPYSATPASFDVTAFVADDDGDPIELLVSPPRGVATPSTSVCMPDACAFHLDDPGAGTTCGLSTPTTIGVRLRDGGPDVSSHVAYDSCL